MKFQSSPIDEHVEVPLADEGRWERLVERWSTRDRAGTAASEACNACYVLSVRRPDSVGSPEAQLHEMTSLVETQGDRVVGARTYLLQRPDARTLLRKGVAERIAVEAREHGADLLVVDAELTPSQARNLENATGLPISDREAVILNVFERHATTRRARIQVEIAHLEYLRPRIRGIGLNMDQQREASDDDPIQSDPGSRHVARHPRRSSALPGSRAQSRERRSRRARRSKRRGQVDVARRAGRSRDSRSRRGVLATWPGGLVVVSHDVDFLKQIGIERRLELGERQEPELE